MRLRESNAANQMYRDITSVCFTGEKCGKKIRNREAGKEYSGNALKQGYWLYGNEKWPESSLQILDVVLRCSNENQMIKIQ